MDGYLLLGGRLTYSGPPRGRLGVFPKGAARTRLLFLSVAPLPAADGWGGLTMERCLWDGWAFRRNIPHLVKAFS